ncbi:hypothetical protein EVAR_4278_1 [Eumeta japonica]|uniref:Uncharacterized protein n=1 Tax=Eumeta variegata TaxID=151549 RepID=A0A4C1VDV9_EUMVA|nr:hypothetical protein EVAR_4278_1 [Eumeta japonica]
MSKQLMLVCFNSGDLTLVSNSFSGHPPVWYVEATKETIEKQPITSTRRLRDSIETSKDTIHCQLKSLEFKQGRINLSNEFRDGRPSTDVNNKSIDGVRRMIKIDRHVICDEIQAFLGIDMSQIQSILHKHLGDDDVPSESQCRPYIEKALKELEGGTESVQRTNLCRSELPANDAMRRFNALRLFFLLCVLRRCDSFVTDFTAVEFRALYCK